MLPTGSLVMTKNPSDIKSGPTQLVDRPSLNPNHSRYLPTFSTRTAGKQFAYGAGSQMKPDSHHEST